MYDYFYDLNTRNHYNCSKTVKLLSIVIELNNKTQQVKWNVVIWQECLFIDFEIDDHPSKNIFGPKFFTILTNAFIGNEIWMTAFNIMLSFILLSSIAYRWRFIWRDKWSLLENARGQCWHWNGLAPVCFLICRVSSSERANLQVHPSQEQRYGFSPRMCENRVLIC